jgi:hypothetical protein
MVALLTDYTKALISAGRLKGAALMTPCSISRSAQRMAFSWKRRACRVFWCSLRTSRLCSYKYSSNSKCYEFFSCYMPS